MFLIFCRASHVTTPWLPAIDLALRPCRPSPALAALWAVFCERQSLSGSPYPSHHAQGQEQNPQPTRSTAAWCPQAIQIPKLQSISLASFTHTRATVAGWTWRTLKHKQWFWRRLHRYPWGPCQGPWIIDNQPTKARPPTCRRLQHPASPHGHRWPASCGASPFSLQGAAEETQTPPWFRQPPPPSPALIVIQLIFIVIFIVIIIIIIIWQWVVHIQFRLWSGCSQLRETPNDLFWPSRWAQCLN